MTSTLPNLSQSNAVVSYFDPRTSGESPGRAFTFTITSLRFQTSVLPVETATSLPTPISSSASTTSSRSPNFQTSTSTKHTDHPSTSSSFNNQPHTPIVVGVLVGVFVFIVLLASTIVVWVKRSKKQDAAEPKEVKATKPTPFLGDHNSSDNSLEDRVTGYGQNDGESTVSTVVAASTRSRSHIVDLSSEMVESTGRPVVPRYKTGQDFEERLNKVMQKLEIIEAAIQLHTHGWHPRGHGKGDRGHNYSEASRSRETIGAGDRPPRYALNMEPATSSHRTTDIVNKDLNRIV